MFVHKTTEFNTLCKLHIKEIILETRGQVSLKVYENVLFPLRVNLARIQSAISMNSTDMRLTTSEQRQKVLKELQCVEK